jgi:hypothetical protein
MGRQNRMVTESGMLRLNGFEKIGMQGSVGRIVVNGQNDKQESFCIIPLLQERT